MTKELRSKKLKKQTHTKGKDNKGYLIIITREQVDFMICIANNTLNWTLT